MQSAAIAIVLAPKPVVFAVMPVKSSLVDQISTTVTYASIASARCAQTTSRVTVLLVIAHS